MAVVAIVLVSTASSFAGEIDHARFMGEFAQFVQHEVASEKEIRVKLDTFILENRKYLADGFGKHPEFMPKIYELAGTGKLSCLSSRYYAEFQKDLTNEEREAFYNTKRNMDRWVLMVAVEEAATLKVTGSSSPFFYRFREDFPNVIAESMKAAVRPYLNAKPGKEGVKGVGFDDIPCD